MILPYLLRRDWSFEAALAMGVFATIIAYVLGVYAAQQYGGLSA